LPELRHKWAPAANPLCATDLLDRARLGVILVKLTKETAMSAAIINLYEAKTSLSRLVERAAAGEEIIIAKAGKPKARLVPLAANVEARQPGGWEGKVWVAEDFDEPLPPDILAGFDGKD
jgi:prevent-host-death family protein